MSVPGFMINKAPQKPINTLIHLFRLTLSFRNITEKITTINGPTWKIVIVVTKVRYLKPANINRVAPNSNADLNRWSFNRLVAKTLPKLGENIIIVKIVWLAYLPQTISMIGKARVKLFARAFIIEKSNTVRSINTIPVKYFSNGMKKLYNCSRTTLKNTHFIFHCIHLFNVFLYKVAFIFFLSKMEP